MSVEQPAVADRVVVVTGGGTGIGATYVAALTAAGHQVVVADLETARAPAEQVVATADAAGPGRAVFAPTDITVDESLDAMVQVATEEFGGIDAVVCNAALYGALGAKRQRLDLRPEDWDRVLAVNVRGTWQTIRAVAPVMAERGGGSIVTISSVVARNGAPGFAHYVASKAAVEGLTKAAARELGGHGITVNAVAPGLVSDDATRAINDPDYIAMVAGTRAMAREMQPQDLVGTVLWLCSPASAFLTGQTIVVDGGGVFT